MSPPDQLLLTPSKAERFAAGLVAIMATTVVGVAVARAARGEGVEPAAVVIAAGLALLARALWVRRLCADGRGLTFHDGVFEHHLTWGEVDGIVDAHRGLQHFGVDAGFRSAVHVLHQGRFIDVLPLPRTEVGKSSSGSASAVAAALREVRRRHRPGATDDWCPGRTVGGLRGRWAIQVVQLRPGEKTENLYYPNPRMIPIRCRTYRRRAEAARSASATDWQPPDR